MSNRSKQARVQFRAETNEFSKQIHDANASLAALRAGMKLNEAEFKNTGNSAEYLKQKQDLLNAQMAQSKTKQEALNNTLQKAKEIYGSDSAAAAEWETKLNRAKTEEENLKKALNETENAIQEQTDAEERAKTPLEQLNSKITGQREELERLKTEYANVALSEGKDSEAAQNLKGKIDALNGELDENEKKLRDVTDATDDAGKAADDSAKGGWNGLHNFLSNLATDAVEFVISKLREAATAVVKLGADFTSSLSNVEALSGATSEEMEKLKNAALDLGRNTIFSASQVSDAFSYMALAGWDVDDMLDGIDGVLDLAASANMDLAKASDIVTDNLTAFGLEAQDAGLFVDQMAYAMANSNTDVEQLGEAYKNVAATAASMGYSVEDTTAALMTMANAGVKGGEAGTGLNAIMTRLATDTRGCATALQEYGIEVYNADGSMNSLSSILNGIAGVWEDLTDQEQASLAKTIAGQSQYSKLQTIMAGLSQSAAESGQSFNDYTEALENCEGTAQSMSDTMQDNLAGDLKELGSAAEGLGLQLFSYLEGPLRGAAQLATDVINGITDAITPQETALTKFIDDIEESNKQVRNSIDLAGQTMSDAEASVAEMEVYKDLLLDLAGKTELTELEQYELKTAMEALGDTVPGLKEAYDETNGTLSATNQELVNMFNNAEAMAMQNAIIKANSEAYDALAQAAYNEALATQAVEKAQKEYDEVAQKHAETMDMATGVSVEYQDAYEQAQKTLLDAQKAQEEAAAAAEDANEVLELNKEVYEDLGKQYGLTNEELENLNDTQEKAGETAEEAAEEVTEAQEEMQQSLAETAAALGMTEEEFESFSQGVKKSMESSVDMMQAFSGGAEITAEEIEQNLQSQLAGISQWSENMARLGGAAGDGMTQELYDALLEMGPSSANLVNELVKTLDGDTEQFRRICSEWGQAMNLSENADALAAIQVGGAEVTEGIAESIRAGGEDIASAAQQVTDDAVKKADATKAASSATKEVQSTAKQSMQSAQKEVQSGMDSMNQEAAKGLSSLSLAFQREFSDMRQSVSNEMSLALSSVTSGISQMRQALSTTLRGPTLQLPHFKMTGAFDAKKNKVPEVSVEWYAKGAIFTKPTILATDSGYKGVGEAGAEAVLPIERLKDYIETAIETAAAPPVNVYMTVDGAEDPEAWAATFVRGLKQQMRI